MLLMVSFSTCISPFASTLIFWLMSPFAMACVTVEMLLTYEWVSKYIDIKGFQSKPRDLPEL
jgi:hypothetical protein